MMDHKAAVSSMAVEKYLLDEFKPEERDAFEEHFFSCDECAKDIKAGAALMAHGKEIFEQEKFVPRPRPVPAPKPKWFGWLRPAFALPAMAFMLGIVVFQNLVQVPALHQSLIALNAPGVLPSVDLHSGSARGEDRTVVAAPGELFQLTLDLPDTSDAAHSATLYDAGGRKLWSLPIPTNAPKEGLTLKMPGDLPAGSYSLAINKVDGAGASEISRYAFVLRRQ